jgi:hypothetical protein
VGTGGFFLADDVAQYAPTGISELVDIQRDAYFVMFVSITISLFCSCVPYGLIIVLLFFLHNTSCVFFSFMLVLLLSGFVILIDIRYSP